MNPQTPIFNEPASNESPWCCDDLKFVEIVLSFSVWDFVFELTWETHGFIVKLNWLYILLSSIFLVEASDFLCSVPKTLPFNDSNNFIFDCEAVLFTGCLDKFKGERLLPDLNS